MSRDKTLMRLVLEIPSVVFPDSVDRYYGDAFLFRPDFVYSLKRVYCDPVVGNCYAKLYPQAVDSTSEYGREMIERESFHFLRWPRENENFFFDEGDPLVFPIEYLCLLISSFPSLFPDRS